MSYSRISDVSEDMEMKCGDEFHSCPNKKYDSFQMSPQSCEVKEKEPQRMVYYAVLSLVVGVLLLMAASSSFALSPTGVSEGMVFAAATEPRPCDFSECQRTLCDATVAPFVCVTGEKGVRS